MRYLLITLSIVSFIFSEDSTDKDSEFKNHNLSVGILDDKTGISIIGYTYNVKKNQMNEYFFGVGTMALAFTGTIGWKHYLYKELKTSIYSVLSEQIVAHMGFSGYMSTISLSLEHKLKWGTIKAGYFATFIIRTDENKEEFGAFPFVGLSFDF